mmetsp:Transcript_20101/g.43638  ORF Transcript_20101/g.43638 Transcript_20101/m.43638 type:complete len:120 (+) Transcript_20101:124-483(+)
MILSNIDNLVPNNFKCANAGKITLTIIVQINPTSEHKKLNDGKNIATANARNMSTIFTTESTSSIARSLGRIPVNISSKPRAKGNIVKVNLLMAVKIISHVNPDIRPPPSDSFSSEIVI